MASADHPDPTEAQRAPEMEGFDPRFETPPDYILGITHEIWEGRGVETLRHYYAPQIPVRSPAGVVVGNEAVIAATHATLEEFPDRKLLGEDVIWSSDPDGGFLSSHRIMSTATHTSDGAYGPATGTGLRYRVLADCAARSNQIYDEWLIRDQGAIARQLGIHPRQFAADAIAAEGGARHAQRPLTPEEDLPATYTATGNDHPAGQRYRTHLESLIAGDGSAAPPEWAPALSGDPTASNDYDRAVQAELPGGRTVHGSSAATSFWRELRAALPDAEFTVHHQIGRDDPHMCPRAALRWSLDGIHSGAGAFGEPTGARIHVMGISHAEFGPWGLRREFVLYDETSIWKQILLHTG